MYEILLYIRRRKNVARKLKIYYRITFFQPDWTRMFGNKRKFILDFIFFTFSEFEFCVTPLFDFQNENENNILTEKYFILFLLVFRLRDNSNIVIPVLMFFLFRNKKKFKIPKLILYIKFSNRLPMYCEGFLTRTRCVWQERNELKTLLMRLWQWDIFIRTE